MNIIFKPHKNADYILANLQPYRSLRLSNNWSFEKLNPLSLIRQGVNKFNTSFTCLMEWIRSKFSFNFFFVRSRCFCTVYFWVQILQNVRAVPTIWSNMMTPVITCLKIKRKTSSSCFTWSPNFGIFSMILLALKILCLEICDNYYHKFDSWSIQ